MVNSMSQRSWLLVSSLALTGAFAATGSIVAGLLGFTIVLAVGIAMRKVHERSRH